LRGEDSISEICRKEGIAPNQYYGWSKEFLEAGKQRMVEESGLPVKRTLEEIGVSKSSFYRWYDRYLAADCPANTLFLWQPDTKSERQAIKLAAIIKNTAEYIFVDRIGSRVMAINKKELAQKLRDGTLVIIQIPQYFDKALKALIQNTRKN